MINRVQPGQTSPSIQRMLAVSVFRKFRSKELIVRQGSISESVYFVMSGSVTVERCDESGRRLVYSYLRPGEFFGEIALFEEYPQRSATVVAKMNCEIAVVGLSSFQKLINDDSELLFELARQLAERLKKTNEKLSNLAFLDVTGRMARTLLDLAADDEAITHPDGMMIKITRVELGRLVNCSRELAGQVLHSLEEQGLIDLEGRNIIVH